MSQFKELPEAYNSCMADGKLIKLNNVNTQKVMSLMENAETDINSAGILTSTISRTAREWQSVFTLHYDALRTYVDAFLLFDKIKSVNHQCVFAYLCTHHPKLELDWNFFEKVRTKRNGSHYYGDKITFEDWKQTELQMKLYTKTIKDEIERELKAEKR